MLLPLLWGAPVRGQDVSSEYRVKAAYLYSFVKFVEWPPQATTGPIIICVADQNPFGSALSDTLRGETVNGRPVAARLITEPDPSCHVLYIPSGTPTATFLRAALTLPILTVGEDPAFLDDGGDIRFVLEDGRVRFDINARAAQRVELRISSRLLRLAHIVEGGGTP